MTCLKRPLFAVGVSGFCALICAALLPSFTVVSLLVVCVATGVVTLPFRRCRAVAVCVLSAAVAIGGFLVAEVTLCRPLAELDGKVVTVCGKVTETGSVSHNVITVTVETIDGGDLPAGMRVRLHAPFADLPPVYGDEVGACVTLSRSDVTEERALFDSAKANRTFLSGWTDNVENFCVTRRDSRSLAKSLSLAKASVCAALLDGMPRDVSPLLCAMCLGDKSALSNEVIRSFRRSGVSHLLVVSGLHTSIVAMGLYGLLRKLRVSRKAASAAALVLLWAFGLLVGFHPSVVRACVLNTFVLSGNLFRRRADGLNSLGGGLLLLWLINPFCVYDVGLWLSFGATLGLLWLLPPMIRVCDLFFEKTRTEKLRHPLRFVAKSLCVTFAATLPILPMCAVVFGEVSLVAPLTNLLTVFAATLLLWCAAGALFLSTIHLGFLAGGLRLCATLLSRYLLWVTSLCGGIPGATVSTDAPYRRWWVIVTVLAVLFLWKFRNKKTALAGFAALCVVLCGLCVGDNLLAKGKTDLSLVRAYGDTAVMLEKDGETCLLVDGGNGWVAATSRLDRADGAEVDTVVVLDASRRLTRKWEEFNDRVAVRQYVLTEHNKATAATIEEKGATQVAVAREVTLFDGAVVVRAEESRVTVNTVNGSEYIVDLTDKTDASVRLD